MSIKKMKKEKQLHNRHYYRKYDRILRELNTDCKTPSESWEHIIDLRYLKNKGYIDLEESPTLHKITLTPKGMILRSEGGFIEQDNLRKKLVFYKVLSGLLALATIVSILYKLELW